MSNFSVLIEIGDPSDERWQRVDAMVDTGAAYTSIPRDVLGHLGVSPTAERAFLTADGRVIDLPVGELRCRLNGEEAHTLVVFAEPQAPALLGAVTLETFALAVDPLEERLVPRRLYLL